MENEKNMLPMVERDEWLHPVADKVQERYNRFVARLGAIGQQAGSIVAVGRCAGWLVVQGVAPRGIRCIYLW